MCPNSVHGNEKARTFLAIRIKLTELLDDKSKIYSDNMDDFFIVLDMKNGNRVLKLTEP
jgi:hypothetical protein